MDISKLTKKEAASFFINIFNTLMIHAFVAVGFPTSKLDFAYIKAYSRYSISGMLFSLDDILHGLLRGNVRPQDTSRPYFQLNDPRARYSIERDPRILFLLATHLPFSPYVRNIETPDALLSYLDCGIHDYVQGR